MGGATVPLISDLYYGLLNYDLLYFILAYPYLLIKKLGLCYGLGMTYGFRFITIFSNLTLFGSKYFCCFYLMEA